MNTAEQQETSEGEVFDKDGNRIVFRDRPPAVQEMDDQGRAITRMSTAGARSTRGMDPMELLRDQWSKGIVEDQKWLRIYAACIQGAGPEGDMAVAAEKADRAYFEWWQRMEATRTTS